MKPIFQVSSGSLSVLALLLLAAGHPVRADVALAAVFTDNAVLQQGIDVPIWGTAAPGEDVAVTFGDQNQTTHAAPDGRWSLTLGRLSADPRPLDLVVRGRNTVTVHNVLVGEVWLCSGQSNMEKPIGERAGQKPVFNAEAEIRDAHWPQLRLLKVPKLKADAPGTAIASHWEVCGPYSIDRIKFSAAGYFFGRRLFQDLRIPIGLIDSTYGGTAIELWTPAGKTGTLYNGMIAPLVPFGLRGILWYQGESNLIDDNDGDNYAARMATLVRTWRKAWGEGDVPFYYVQLAPHLYHVVRPQFNVSSQGLPVIWEAQTACLRLPQTGMVVTTDLVDDLFDIHPRNKQEVGRRLALIALAKTYGREGLVYSGPMFQSLEIQGARAIVHFTDLGGGLVSRDGKPLSWFTIAAAGGEFQPGTAVIAGDTVVVTSPKVAAPAAVRFAWDEAAQPNLSNQAGLPAGPFRSDAPPIDLGP